MGSRQKKIISEEHNDLKENDSFKLIFLVIIALLATFFLIPIEKYLLPWPWFLEEILKLVVIWYFILPLRCWYCRLLFGLTFVLVFSVSENILYFPFFVQLQDLGRYWERFVYPLGMHLLTFYILLFSAWQRRCFIFIGLLFACLIHYYYNDWALVFFASR